MTHRIADRPPLRQVIYPLWKRCACRPWQKGSVSALLKTLGGMSPEERQVNGPAFNQLRDRVTAAIADKKHALEGAALEARLASETQT